MTTALAAWLACTVCGTLPPPEEIEAALEAGQAADAELAPENPAERSLPPPDEAAPLLPEGAPAVAPAPVVPAAAASPEPAGPLSVQDEALRAEDAGDLERALELLRLALKENDKDERIAFDLARIAVRAARNGHRPDVTDVEPLLRMAPVSSEARLLRSFLIAERFNVATTVATRSTERRQSDTPGVVTVVTRDEILDTGARDMIDVLQYVAGFAFGADTMGTVSAGFRGMWGAEGKMLVLLDGHEMHELTYLSNYFGNRFSVDWIDRVEIIRGPGSVMYGGAAELAVISIITRKAASIGGGSGAVVYGQMLGGVATRDLRVADTYGRRNASVSGGHVFENLGNLALKLDVFAGQGNRSDRRFTDAEGTSFNLTDRYGFSDGHVRRTAASDPLMVNASVELRGLKVRYLLEDWRQTDRTGIYRTAFVHPYPLEWRSQSVLADYEWEVLPHLKVAPHFGFLWQNPWRSVGPDADSVGMAWNLKLMRTQPSLSVSWAPWEGLDTLAGVEYTADQSRDDLYGYPDASQPDNPSATVPVVKYHNIATFAQALLDTPVVNVAGGVRFERHNVAGDSLVPRAAASRSFGPFHAKALYSQAMRVPNIESLGSLKGLAPEQTTVMELELGVQAAEFLYVGVNGFDTTIRNAIIYGYDPAIDRTRYSNGGRIGTRGAEAELRFLRGRTWGNLQYSYYNAAGKNAADTVTGLPNPYVVPGHDAVLLAFAPHKLTLAGGFEPVPKLTVNPSVSILFGDRFGYAGRDSQGEPRLVRYPVEKLVNVNIVRRDLVLPGVFMSLGVRNLLNDKQSFVRPYLSRALQQPTPGPSLEVLVKIGYDTYVGEI